MPSATAIAPLPPARRLMEWINPLWSGERLRARVEQLVDETADCRTLVLKPGRGWRGHQAGQHLTIGVNVAGRLQHRTFSISSAPEEQRGGRFTITVKGMAEGGVSRHIARQVQVGELLDIGQAQGDFVLPPAVPRRALFVSAGSGVTPIMAFLRSLSLRGRLWDVVHVHYAAMPQDVIFGRALDVLQAREPGYRLFRLHTQAGGGTGRFSAGQLARLCPDWADREAYACGPAGLLDALAATWAAAGLAEQLRMERFQAVRAAAPAEVKTGTVRFARSGVAAASDGVTPLLLLAEAQGLTPPHGCRMGICHGCDATLVSGCVRDLRTNALLNRPGQTVQPCVCAAAGDASLEI